MLRTLLTLLLLTFTAKYGPAQPVFEDVVYLKNGSVIRGTLLSHPPAQPIKIELLGGTVLVFTEAETDSITRENALKSKINRIKKDYYRRNRGYRHITEFGLVYGTGLKGNGVDPYNYYSPRRDDVGISLHTVNGYQIWPYLFVGAGVGIDRFITYGQNFSPFYLRVATEFLKQKVTPYVFCDAGYAVMWKQKNNQYIQYSNKGGVYVMAGGGVRIYTRSRASVLLSLGYKRNYSQTKWWYTTDSSGTYYTITRIYQRLVLGVGVTM